MLGFVDEVKAAGSVIMPMQQHDAEGQPIKVYDFIDNGKKTPGAPEVRWPVLLQPTRY